MKKNKEQKTKEHKNQEDLQKEDAVQNEPAAGAADAAESVEASSEEDETEKLKARMADLNDKYVRLVAEFDNYRRRTARERLELIEQADKDVLLGFLPIVDDCERALDVLRKSDASAAAVEGTELILTKLFNYLKSKGVTRIEAKGEDFNTDLHEAVAQFPAPSPKMKNKVIDVTENGYLLRGKVMRFAKVVVGI